MTSVTFTPASVKSKALAPLHRHEKRLKSCMRYKKYISKANVRRNSKSFVSLERQF